VKSFTDLPKDADYSLMSKIMSPVAIADPSEIASAFAYIASDDGRFITGSVLTIDGGIVC